MSPDESATPARILVVEDHPIVRLGIRQMLAQEPSLAICGEADSPDTAMEMVQSSNPDLAVVDLTLRDGSGLELIRSLHAAQPRLPILVLSIHDEALFAERAIRAGARGYVMKQAAITGLIQAIQQVLSGRMYVSERIAQGLLERLGSEAAAVTGRIGNLTDREIEVLELVGHGSTTAEIADRLGVSVKTIETYRSNIKTKLELKDAADLIRFATMWTLNL